MKTLKLSEFDESVALVEIGKKNQVGLHIRPKVTIVDPVRIMVVFGGNCLLQKSMDEVRWRLNDGRRCGR